jgi:2-C-methyl-D-erythritol 4-phosphate cytidylyltransferase
MAADRTSSGPAIAAAVILASGSGTRVGGQLNKVYLPLAGRRVVEWSIDALSRVPGVGVVVLVIRAVDEPLLTDVAAGVEIVTGGATRQESELMALRHLASRIADGRIDAVLIHDAARPLVTTALAAQVLRVARESGGAVPGLPRTDLALVDASGARIVDAGLGRLVAVQTPQGFSAAPLLDAYERAAADGFAGTDTAACMAEYSDVPVRCIPGDEDNMKITYPADIAVAEALLTARVPSGPGARGWPY